MAYVDGEEEEKTKARTSVDERGGENPVWNDVLTLSVREAPLRKDSLACLIVDIYSRGGRHDRTWAWRLPFITINPIGLCET